MSAFFVLVSLTNATSTHAASFYNEALQKTGKTGGGVLSIRNCTNKSLSPPQNATVKWVYDGDTLLLNNKQKIRIIGIDTPETKHHKQKAEAYGAKAREAIRELLKKYHYKITLRYGKEKQDRYKRTLAHVYLADGTNVSTWLLERGYAKTLAYPPNVLLANCYKQAEVLAQEKSLRIWKYKKNKIRNVETLPAKTKGYVRLKGRVKRIFKSRKSTFIEFKSSSKRPIQLKIKKKNLGYFKSYNINELRNQIITVSGFLKNKNNRRVINLNHPTQIEITQRENNSPPLSKAKQQIKKVVPTIEWSSKNEN